MKSIKEEESKLTMIGLGQTETADLLACAQIREEFVLLFLRAIC
jgi:hypothetical protein